MYNLEDQSSGSAAKTRLEKLDEKVPCLGILLCICASLSLVSAVMMVKLFETVNGLQVAFFKSLVQVIVYCFIIKFRGISFKPVEGETQAVAIRAFTSSLSMSIAYYVLKLITLGDLVAIRSSMPIWTLILGYLILGEPIGLIMVIAVLISFSGLILIAKPDDCIHLYFMIKKLIGFQMVDDSQLARGNSTNYAFGEEVFEDSTQRTFGCVLALCSAIPLAISIIALRKCRKTPAEVIIFWLSLAALCITAAGLTLVNEWTMPSGKLEWFLIGMSGVFASLGHFFLTSASKVELSSVIALMRNVDPVVAFLYSAFILEEVVQATSVIGSCLVGSGVVAVILKKMYFQKESTQGSDSQVAEKAL